MKRYYNIIHRHLPAFFAVTLLVALPVVAKAAGSVSVFASVPLLVDQKTSAVVGSANSLSVVLRDANDLPLKQKIVAAPGLASGEVRSGPDGAAVLLLAPEPGLRVGTIIADRLGKLGTFGYLYEPPFWSRLFSTAHAQEPTLSLSPAKVRESVVSGQNKTEVLTVTNGAATTQHLEVYLSDYQAINDQGTEFQFSLPGTHSDSLAQIISIDPRRFDLDPGQSREINVRIEAPVGYAAGMYKGAVLVGTAAEPLSTGDETKLAVEGKLGALLGVEIISPGQRPASLTARISQEAAASPLLYIMLCTLIVLIVIILARLFYLGYRRRRLKHASQEV